MGIESEFAPDLSLFAPIFQVIDLSNSASFCQVKFVLNLAPFFNRNDSSILHLFCPNLGRLYTIKGPSIYYQYILPYITNGLSFYKL